VKCGHYGCSKEYNPDENNDTSCIYHPGNPTFHDGLKGWSCCKKRVISFEEFMEIPGCGCAFHEPAAAPAVVATTRETPVPKYKPESKPPTIEVHKASQLAPISTPPPPKPTPPVEEDDLVDAVFAPGAPCQHRGCNYKYVDETSRTAPCIYHPGAPVFHEGSKGYTCCKMVAEFEQFLSLPGCKTGKHKFTEPPKSKEGVVECRNDWYQLGPSVIVCVYAKNVDKQQSVVSFDEHSLKVELKFNDGKRFSKSFNLAQTIVPEKSTFEFLSTKVEIKLYKSDASQWAKLEI